MNTENPEQPEIDKFKQRELVTKVMFSEFMKRIEGRDDIRTDATFRIVEKILDQEIVSPITLRGEVLEHDLVLDDHLAFKVMIFEESASTEDLPFEPPASFKPDEEDDVARIVDWHNTVRVDLEPQQLIRQLKYGDVFGLILSTRLIR